MKLIDTLSATPRELRDVYGCFPSGVVAIAALVEGDPVGLVASSFTTVSLDPPLLLLSIQTKSATWPVLKRAACMGVSVLGEGQQLSCRKLSADAAERFVGVDWSTSDDQAVFISGAAAHFLCSLDQEHEAGDHVLALLRIHGFSSEPRVAPMIFHQSRFKQLAGDLELS